MSRVSLFERCWECGGDYLYGDECKTCNGEGSVLTDRGHEVAHVVEMVLRERERKAREEACDSKVTEK